MLKTVGNGKGQLPDFQRSWLWDDIRICKLIESLTSGFPRGAALFLDYSVDAGVKFKYRLFEGGDKQYKSVVPLVLGGQQRLTTCYKVFMNNASVITTTNTDKDNIIKRYYYMDIKKAIEPEDDALESHTRRLPGIKSALGKTVSGCESDSTVQHSGETCTENSKKLPESIIAAAARLAKRLHKGQVDKAGVDYFTGHLSAVAAMGGTWQEQIVGYLHDASEDTPHSVDEILDLLNVELGKPLPSEDREEIGIALRLLNHHTAPDRESYIRAIGTNTLATAVKLHDLTHNMDLSRIPSPTEKDLARVNRYRKEYDYLNKIYQSNHKKSNSTMESNMIYNPDDNGDISI